jgi:hypothetical protein
MLNSLQFSQEYCWKYGQEKFIKMLESCGENSQTKIGDFE